MKKITLLSCVFALFAGTSFAESVEVTTAEMNAQTQGSLLYVMANAPANAETTIEFNFDGKILNYGDGVGFSIGGKGKKLTFNGTNKKNGEKVTIMGTASLFNLTDTAEVNLNNLIVTGFKGIAIKVGGGATIKADRCIFTENVDPLNASGNNGGVMRVSASKAFIKNSLFSKNKGTGSYGGGVICAYDASELRVENCSFIQNTASSGGGICVNARKDKGLPVVYIANSTFANNYVANRGGALYMYTAEANVAFAPIVVNCTFVGNFTDTDGGAVCLWANATAKPMKPVFINNLFVENFEKPYSIGKEVNNDFCSFYYKGDVSGTTIMEQTVIPTCKNNLYTGVVSRFFTDTANKKLDFTTSNIFNGTEQNPWDESDPEYKHQTSKLSSDMLIAMIAENSAVKGSGIAKVDGVEIPTTDQLGNVRPAIPSVGAVEYGALTGILNNFVNDSNVKVWNDGNLLYVNGIDGNVSVSLYDTTGKEVYKGTIGNGSSVSINGINKGIYIAKVKNSSIISTTKLVIK